MHSWTEEERHEWSARLREKQRAWWAIPENKKRMSEAIRKGRDRARAIRKAKAKNFT
jgi:hypothetical protein